MRYCDVPGCENIHRARGYCRKHYMKQYGRYWRMRNPEKAKAHKQKYADLTPEQKKAYNDRKRDWRRMLPLSKQEETKEKERERMRERYYALKEQGICTTCGQRPAVTTRCDDCQNKRKAKQQKPVKKEEEAWWI